MTISKKTVREEIEDKGFGVYFKEPNSFTGEDVVEFQCHGGFLVAQKIIEQCLKFGARLATPGEFSKRAFLNGKMSLDQAEGVVDTINAETDSQLKASNDITNGALFKLVVNQQNVLTDILSEIEATIEPLRLQSKFSLFCALATIDSQM